MSAVPKLPSFHDEDDITHVSKKSLEARREQRLDREKTGEFPAAKDAVTKAMPRYEEPDFKRTPDSSDIVLNTRKPRVKAQALSLFITQAMEDVLLRHRQIELDDDLTGDEYEREVEDLDKMETRLARMRRDLEAAEKDSKDGLVPNPFYRSAAEQGNVMTTTLHDRDLEVVDRDVSFSAAKKLLKSLEKAVKLENKKGGAFALSAKQLVERGGPASDFLLQDLKQILPKLGGEKRAEIESAINGLYAEDLPSRQDIVEGELFGLSAKQLKEIGELSPDRAFENPFSAPSAREAIPVRDDVTKTEPLPPERLKSAVTTRLPSQGKEWRPEDTIKLPPRDLVSSVTEEFIEIADEDVEELHVSPEERERILGEIRGLLEKLAHVHVVRIGNETTPGDLKAHGEIQKALKKEIEEKAFYVTAEERRRIHDEIARIARPEMPKPPTQEEIRAAKAWQKSAKQLQEESGMPVPELSEDDEEEVLKTSRVSRKKAA